MKIISMILLALICLPVSALAENESVIMGPYNVSFDLAGAKNMISYHIEPVHESISEDLSSDYTNTYYFSINISQPSVPKNRYKNIDLSLITSNSTIPKYDELYYKREIYNLLDGFTKEFDFAPRIIDGSQGYVGSGCFSGSALYCLKSYAAIFNPPIDPDHVECRIFSSLVDWEEGTLQLLKTIHVEKINSTS
jgi:hypothetical protein